MEINLLDMMKSQLSGAVMEKASSFLGENPTAASKALSLVLPSVLGSFANKATSTTGATELMNMLGSGGHDGSVLNNLGSVLGGGSATQGLISGGSSIVKGLFGDRVGGIVDMIGSFAGIKSGSASSLMSMVAPLLLGGIGKSLGGNSSVSGLMGLLGGQLPFIQKAFSSIPGLPAGFTNALGFSGLKLDTPSVASVREAATTAVAGAEKSLLSRLAPWLLLAGAALAGVYFLRSNKEATTPKALEKVVEVAPPTAPAVVDTVRKLKVGAQEIVVKTGSFLDQLYTEITDATLDPTKAMAFDNVNFATGSAVITPESKVQLDDLAKIMVAFPNVQVKVDGHTDNAGNAAANKKLSENRAASVKAFLLKAGISAARVATAGFGSEKPVADNATAEGKAKNRRIEAFVTKK
jgi:OmpA-OmpF porin, OOP family